MTVLHAMSSWIEDVYLPRLRARDSELLFDRQDVWESGDRFSEYFLQIVWNERYLVSALRTESGHSLRIIHPGTWNVSAGPDFHNASLVIDGVLLRGDVEIHQRASDWNRHGHGGDPRYNSVCLHVVWENDITLENGPAETLLLSAHLSPEWHILLQDVEDACYPYARQVSSGQCAMRWALSDDASLQSVLASAGLARLAAKGTRIQRLCAEHGTDQALFELFFDSLGYRSNRQPFQELAQWVSLETLKTLHDPLKLQAMLYGTAGLLPDITRETVHPEQRDIVEKLWTAWWELGAERHELVWAFSGTRPFNSPHRRLAAGIAWLLTVDFEPSKAIQSLAMQARTPKALLKCLLEQDYPLGTWASFKDFRTKLPHPVKLLGSTRLKDIAANVILPYLASLDQTDDSDGGLADLARQAFVLIAPGEENRLLTEAAHRFLTPPSRAHDLLKRYCHQQGLLDIYKNFCLMFNSDCASCPFVSADVSCHEDLISSPSESPEEKQPYMASPGPQHSTPPK